MISDIWLKIGALATFIAGLWAWRQKGINTAVDHEKAEAEVKNQAEKLIERDRVILSNAKANEIEERNGKLSDRELFDGLRKYARKDD